jgi:hypothetical protein
MQSSEAAGKVNIRPRNRAEDTAGRWTIGVAEP